MSEAVKGPTSDQRGRYETLCVYILAGEASPQDAVDAIRKLCLDNERLAIIAGEARAEADAMVAPAFRKAAERMTEWADEAEASIDTGHPSGMNVAREVERDTCREAAEAIRAMIPATPLKEPTND